MFKARQIIHATKLVANFKQYARAIEAEPQAILIIQRKGIPLVLMPADIYENILLSRFEETEMEHLESENSRF